jgi:hypothetical protein
MLVGELVEHKNGRSELGNACPGVSSCGPWSLHYSAEFQWRQSEVHLSSTGTERWVEGVQCDVMQPSYSSFDLFNPRSTALQDIP